MMTKMLTIDLYGKYLAGDSRHAQTVMRDLGIDYLEAVPQSIADCWQFWCPTNIPEELPDWISISERDPFQYIGHGLSKEMAERIAAA